MMMFLLSFKGLMPAALYAENVSEVRIVDGRKNLSINSIFHWLRRDAGTIMIIFRLCSAQSSDRIIPASIVFPSPTSSARIAPLLSGDLNANNAAST